MHFDYVNSILTLQGWSQICILTDQRDHVQHVALYSPEGMERWLKKDPRVRVGVESWMQR